MYNPTRSLNVGLAAAVVFMSAGCASSQEATVHWSSAHEFSVAVDGAVRMTESKAPHLVIGHEIEGDVPCQEAWRFAGGGDDHSIVLFFPSEFGVASTADLASSAVYGDGTERLSVAWREGEGARGLRGGVATVDSFDSDEIVITIAGTEVCAIDDLNAAPYDCSPTVGPVTLTFRTANGAESVTPVEYCAVGEMALGDPGWCHTSVASTVECP